MTNNPMTGRPAPSIANTLTTLLFLGSSLVAGAASAATCVTGGSGETPLQGIFDNITVSGNSSVNAASGCLADGSDSSWSVGDSGTSLTTLVIEIAGNASTNTFGIYDSTNSSLMVELFDGAATGSAQTTLGIGADGTVSLNGSSTGVKFAGNNFGYYLGTASNGTFFSNTALNADGVDHMLAYQGKGDTIQVPGLGESIWSSSQYALAWEDLQASDLGVDYDFNDFVVMIDTAPSAVPVPAAVWLFGSGLVGLIGVARRRKT